MSDIDLTLFNAAEVTRMLADLEKTLRLVGSSIQSLPPHDVPAHRLVHIAELEDKRARYQERLVELARTPAVQPALATAALAGDRPARLRILFLAASPRDQQLLSLDEEVRAIQLELQASRGRDGIVLVPLAAVRPDDLLRELAAHTYDVVHFSGHAHDGELFLHDEDGQSASVPAAPLVDLLRTRADTIRLVVLNACSTESLATQIATVVPCVVAMTDDVEDRAAAVFAKAFYRAVGFGLSVENAFVHGTTALRFARFAVTPILKPRSGVDPSRMFLA